MRILISLLQTVPWGGSDELWADTARQALQDGHQLAVSVPDWRPRPEPLEWLSEHGALLFERSHMRDGPSRTARILKRLRLREVIIPPDIPRLSTAIRNFAPDVILLNQWGTYCNCHPEELSALTNDYAVPLVTVCHWNDENPVRDSWRTRARMLFKKSWRVAFVSRANWVAAERQLAMRLENAIVVQNPVNLKDTFTLPFPEATAPIVFASVARLQAIHKGQDILFEVLGQRAWQKRDWKLRLCGEGVDRDYLAELAEFCGIQDRIEWCGQVRDIRAVWADSHALVMPSRSEGTPLTLIEAMLCGRPTVACAVAGIPEWIEDGRTGFLCEAPTAVSFGAALERAWQARARWAEMGQAAHEAASQRRDATPGKSLLRLLVDAAQTATARNA